MLTVYDIIENYEYAAPDTPVMVSVGQEMLPCTSTSISATRNDPNVTFGSGDNDDPIFLISDMIDMIGSLSGDEMGYSVYISDSVGRRCAPTDVYTDIDDDLGESFVIAS